MLLKNSLFCLHFGNFQLVVPYIYQKYFWAENLKFSGVPGTQWEDGTVTNDVPEPKPLGAGIDANHFRNRGNLTAQKGGQNE